MGATASGGPVFFNMDPPKMVTEERQERIERVKKNHKELLALVYRDFFQLSQDGDCDDIALLLNTMAYIIESAQQMIIDSKKCQSCGHFDCGAQGNGEGVTH